ncbi:MAG: DUF4295 family protein [Chitinophagaceae bacterium]
MAKQAKTAIKTKDKAQSGDTKNWTKVIRATKTQAGSYTFKEAMVHKEKIKDFLAQ